MGFTGLINIVIFIYLVFTQCQCKNCDLANVVIVSKAWDVPLVVVALTEHIEILWTATKMNQARPKVKWVMLVTSVHNGLLDLRMFIKIGCFHYLSCYILSLLLCSTFTCFHLFLLLQVHVHCFHCYVVTLFHYYIVSLSRCCTVSLFHYFVVFFLLN